MNKGSSYYIILFFILLFSQFLLFNQVDLMMSPEYAPYIIVYPLFYMLLPVRTNVNIVLALAFIMGILIDFSLNSPGVHAGASVFGAYMRKFLLHIMEGNSGYSSNSSPGLKDHEIFWVLQYNGALLLFHSFFLFSLEIFTFYFFFSILVKTILTVAFSLIAILIVQLLYKSS